MPRHQGLQVSAYDQAAGLLLSALMILGCTVGLLAVLWYSSRTWLPTPALAVALIQDRGIGGDGPGGAAQIGEPILEEPKSAELSETATPKLEEVIGAISLTAPELLDPNLTDISKGTSTNGRSGSDHLGPGGPEDVAPAAERWEVRLNANTLDEYKRQLDFFRIELGVAGGGSPVVTYVSNVFSAPQVRTGKPTDEKRLRFLHRSGALRSADRKIVSEAGVDADGKIVFQFYPQDTYNKLLTLENIAMQPRRINQVRRTIFGVRGSAGKYEFYVISQEYRS
jgi:hypothetical protein